MANQSIRPKVLIRYGRQNEPVLIPFADLIADPAAMTLLGADSNSASGTITVLGITGFSISQWLLIGEPGTQSAEIIKVHASSAPSGTTITLATNTANNHSAGTSVRVINFDQVEISTAATVGGAKSVLTTASLNPTLEATPYNDLTNPAGYYYARFKNSASGLFSPYSDPAPVAGYTQLTARWVIDSALKEINKTQSDTITDEFCFLALNNFQTEVLQEQKRWGFMQSFNSIVGNIATGDYRIAVPTDLDDQYTNRSTWHLRLGRQRDMTFVDKEKWDDLTSYMAQSTLSVALIAAATTITLTSSRDFDDSGTVVIGANSYIFTANARSTGVLTISTTVTSANTAASGANAFQGASLGEPRYFTIWQGYYYFYPFIGSTFTGRNIYADYYKSQTLIQLDTDTLVVPDQTAAIAYLKWKVLERLNSGKATAESTQQMNIFLSRKANIKAKNTLGRTFRLRPVVNSLDMRAGPGDDIRTRLGNFPNI